MTTIPDNALITSVIFSQSFTVDTSHFSYSINSFDYYLSGAEEAWNGVGSTNRSSIGTGFSDPTFVYTDNNDQALLTAIEDSLENDRIAFCLTSDSEGNNREFARAIITEVFIGYVIPKIIVINDFNSGTLNVNDISRSSGYQLETSVGSSIKIEGITQEYSGQTKYFDKWTNGSVSTSTNPYTFTVTKGLD
ncbi:MAG: hypothetical protein ABIJ40_12935, partial [Bacteroidota bacterium]